MPLNSHGGSDQESGHRRIELNAVELPFAETAGIVEPIDEAEYSADGGQYEQSD